MYIMQNNDPPPPPSIRKRKRQKLLIIFENFQIISIRIVSAEGSCKARGCWVRSVTECLILYISHGLAVTLKV